MKLLKFAISGLERFNNTLEVDFFAEQRVAKDEVGPLFEFSSNLYTNNILAFVGINASGKTSILKVISFVLDFLNCTPINNSEYKFVLDNSEKIVLESFFSKEEKLYKLYTEIISTSSFNRTEYEITKEILFSKEIKGPKKNLYVFDDNCAKVERVSSLEYLKKDISIILPINKNNDFKVRNLLEFTNINVLPIAGDFPPELISFLDPSIEYIRFNNNSYVSLKFYNKQEIILKSPAEMMTYLSSGTIKGILVFVSAMLAFQDGGYLIVDELENHFNREIVATLMSFFKDSEIDRNGATLIFTTHYPELLDRIDRMDSVYFVRNNQGITIRKLNNDIKRNDMKKSDIFISDFLGGTAPSYEKYIDLKKVIIHRKVREKKID